MQPITGGLRLKRKKIPIKWLRPIRLSPITGGKETTGILENWNTGMMGSGQKRKKSLVSLNIPLFHYSIIPKLFHH
jgi:hypothetical protein